MNSEKLAFWGIALKPGEPADLDLQDGETLHVTMASFGANLPDKKGRSVLTATIRNTDDDEDVEKTYALSALTPGKTESVVMDVCFAGQESLSLQVSGKNVVHLVGNFSFEDDVDEDSDDDDAADLIDVYDDGQQVDSDSDDSNDSDDPDSARLLLDSDPPLITEIMEDDEEEPKYQKKTALSKKKADKKEKLANGKGPSSPAKKVSEEKPPVEPTRSPKKEASKKALKKSAKQAKGVSNKAEDTKKAHSSKENAAKKADVVDVSSDDDVSVEGLDDNESNDDSSSEEKVPVAVSPLQKKSKKKMEALNQATPAKKTGGKGHLDDMEEEEDDDKDEDEEIEDVATPEKPKSKRGRKRGNVTALPDGRTPPAATKKSKLSQRPGTPAVIKGAQKGKAAGASSNKKVVSSGEKESKVNGTPKGVVNAPKEGGTPQSSGKKKRRRSRRTNNDA